MHSLMHVHYSNALSKDRYARRGDKPSWKRMPNRPRLVRPPKRSP
jgi:hypothetical protein